MQTAHEFNKDISGSELLSSRNKNEQKVRQKYFFLSIQIKRHVQNGKILMKYKRQMCN